MNVVQMQGLQDGEFVVDHVGGIEGARREIGRLGGVGDHEWDVA